MKARFNKEQTIYQICIEGLKIHECQVVSCGIKQLIINRGILGRKYKPDAKEGRFDNLISIFHETKEQAEIELQKLN